MNTRLSTSMMFTRPVAAMLSGQSRLAHLQQQLATGQRLITAKDDPVAAGQSVNVQRTIAAFEQYEKNALMVKSRLGMQENALHDAGDLMARAKELLVKAGNGIVTLEERQIIADELRSLRESLLGIANAADGNGHYLFAGAADETAPCVNEAGRVVYHGDQVQHRVEIAPDVSVADTIPGSEVFMRIRTGDGSVEAHAQAGNAGTGVVLDFGRSDTAGAFDGGKYCVQFDSAGHYRVVDEQDRVIAEGDYSSGEDIAFAGVHLCIEGNPEPGDEFDLEPAGTKDAFSSLDDLIAALGQPAVGETERAQLNNAVQTGLRTLDRMSAHFISARAACGTQLAKIDAAAQWREASQVELKTDLSGIEDLDYLGYLDAISRSELEKVALQAAQSVFMKMQGMSLFAAAR